MAYLIGSADTARFSSTYPITSNAGGSYGFVNGNQADALSPVAEGPADILNLYIDDWLSQTELKAVLYVNNVPTETVIVPSSAGVGVLSINLAGTENIANANTYRLGIYLPDGSPVSFRTDTGGLTLRYDNGGTGASYTNPVNPLPDCLFDSQNEFYWAIQSSSVAATVRKGETGFTQAHGLGTITTATLNGQAITIASQVAGTVTLDETSGITTSGVYDLVLGDGATTETYSYQLNVVGLAPSNNPVQVDGAAQASLTNVQVRISAGATLSGTEYYYTGTATTDASGNLASVDLSATAAALGESVLLQVMTAAGESITAVETVGAI